MTASGASRAIPAKPLRGGHPEQGTAGREAVQSELGLRAEVRTGIVAFDALQPEWEALVAEQPTASFDVLQAWYRAYLLHLRAPEAGDIVCVVLRRGQHCRGILCLTPTTHARFGVTATVLTAPRGSELMVNSCVLGVGEHLGVWWPSVRDALREAGVPWQVIHVPRMRDDAHLAEISRGLGARRVFRTQDHSRFLDCTPGYDAVRGQYSTRLKKILKKAWNGLRQSGDVALRVASTPVEREAAFDVFLQLESSGWKGPQGERSSLNETPSLRAFYRDLFTGPSAPEQAEINLLTLDGQPIAAQLCMHCGRTRSLLKIAYDQAHAQYSPGSVLLDALVRDSGESHAVDRISFVTNAPWMDEWGASAVPVGDLWLFRSGVTGAAASLLLNVISKP